MSLERNNKFIGPPPKRRQLINDKNNLKLPEIVRSPAEFKKLLFAVIKNADREGLVELLAMDVPGSIDDTKYHMSKSDVCGVYRTLVWNTIDWRARRSRSPEVIISCMRVLLDDPRTSQIPHYQNTVNFIARICSDRRHDMGDVLALVLDHWLRKPLEHCQLDDLIKDSMRSSADRHRMFEVIIGQPTYNINQTDENGRRLVHYVLRFTHRATYNYHNLLPALLADPQFDPELHQVKVDVNFPWNGTVLAIADHFYTDGFVIDGTPRLHNKQRAVNDVRLLLRDSRVDIHKMTNLLVDKIYW